MWYNVMNQKLGGKTIDIKIKERFFDNDVNRMILLMSMCMIVYNFAHPATPGLIELRGWQKNISGVLLAVMSVSMFMASPYLGALGDRLGMKKIMIFMPLFYGCSQVFFGFIPNLWIVFLARAFAGFASGGTHAMAYGYVSLLSKKEEKTKNIAKVSSAVIIGGAIGQKIGGLVATFDTRYPFALQFIVGSLISLFSLFFLKEVVVEKKTQEKSKKDLNPLSTFRYIKELDSFSKFFCFIIFLVGIGINSYASALNYFLKFNVKVSSNTIGTFVMFSLLTAFFGTSVLLKKLIKKRSEEKTYKMMLFIGMICMSVIIFRLQMGVIPYVLMALYTMIYEIVKALGSSVIAKKYKHEQGKILGVASAVNFLGTAIGSLLSGYLLSANVHLPFIVNIIVIGMVLLLIQTSKKLK